MYLNWHYKDATRWFFCVARLQLWLKGRIGLWKHPPQETGHLLNPRLASPPLTGKSGVNIWYSMYLMLNVWSSRVMLLPSGLEDLDRTQPHRMTKLLKTGWVMMLILIRGAYLITLCSFNYILFSVLQMNLLVCTWSVEEVTAGIKRTVMLALGTL